MPNTWTELGHLLTQAIGFPLRRGRSRVRRRDPHGQWPIRRGLLVLAGGGLADEESVEVIHRAGGRRARAVVVPAAHLEHVRAGERYVRYLARFGMQRIEVLDLATRLQADDRATIAHLADADLVVLGGGDTSLLLGLLSGTQAERALAGGLARGAVVVLAGEAAAAAGEAFIDWNAPEGTAVRRGLGLLPHCLVDRQAVRRAQLGRLFWACAGDQLGICLDEATALFCGPGPQAEVHGRGAALAVDGRQVHAEPALTGVPVHVLPDGWRVDLASRQVLPPQPSRPAAGRAR